MEISPPLTALPAKSNLIRRFLLFKFKSRAVPLTPENPTGTRKEIFASLRTFGTNTKLASRNRNLSKSVLISPLLVGGAIVVVNQRP